VPSKQNNLKIICSLRTGLTEWKRVPDLRNRTAYVKYYCSDNGMKYVMGWAGRIHRGNRNMYKILFMKPEAKITLKNVAIE
jgi:hypothetical protein